MPRRDDGAERIVREVLAGHLRAQPRSHRLYRSDARFHETVTVVETVLAAVVSVMRAEGPAGCTMRSTVQGALDRLVTDELLAEHEAVAARFAGGSARQRWAP